MVGCSPCRVRGGVNTVHGGRRSRTRLSAHGINMDVTVIARVGAKRGRMRVAPWEALSAAKHPVWYWYCTVLVRSLRLGRWLASIAGTGMFGGWRHRTIPCIVGIRQPVGGRASVVSSVATAADEGFDYHSVVAERAARRQWARWSSRCGRVPRWQLSGIGRHRGRDVATADWRGRAQREVQLTVLQ